MTRRLIGLALALVALIVGALSSAAAAAESASRMGFITYTYAASIYGAPENYTATKRGPPAEQTDPLGRSRTLT